MYAIVLVDELQIIMRLTKKDVIHDGKFYRDPVQRSRSNPIKPVGLVVGLFGKRPYKVAADFVAYRQWCDKHHMNPGKETSLCSFLTSTRRSGQTNAG